MEGPRLGIPSEDHRSTLSIPKDEYQERWRKVQAACKGLGLDGVVVWSRGGATVDAYADVYYLSNHYSQFPLLRDRPPHWVGRSHAAVVVPADGEPTLVVDLPDWRRDLVAIEDVRFSLDLPAAVAQVLGERGLRGSRLGLVGTNAMLVSPYLRMVEALPGVAFQVVDDLIEKIRVHKSALELKLLREAADVGNAVMSAIMDVALVPGRTEAEAAAAGYAVGATRGAAMYDAAVSSGPNSDYYAYGRLPSWTTRTLEEGDMFHVDTYGAVSGYFFDLSRTCVVGGKPTADQAGVLEGVIDSVEAGVATIRPGVPASVVYQAVQNTLEEHRVAEGGNDSAALLTSFPSHGHSLGLFWEEPWLSPWEETELQAGMCIAVEAMGGRADIGSACFEQVVVINDSGAEVLTTAATRYW